MLIHKICRVDATWLYPRWHCIWTIFTCIILLFRHKISTRPASYHDNSIGIGCWCIKFADSWNVTLFQIVLQMGHITLHILLARDIIWARAAGLRTLGIECWFTKNYGRFNLVWCQMAIPMCHKDIYFMFDRCLISARWARWCGNSMWIGCNFQNLQDSCDIALYLVV